MKPDNLPVLCLDSSYFPPNSPSEPYCSNVNAIHGCIPNTPSMPVAVCSQQPSGKFPDFDSFTEEEQLSYLALNGCSYIGYIRQPSERVQMAVLQDDIKWYHLIQTPCESAKQYVKNKLAKVLADVEQW